MITPEIVTAYHQCQLKAYLLLCDDKRMPISTYSSMIEDKTDKNRTEYFKSITLRAPQLNQFSTDNMKKGKPILLGATLEIENLKAYVDSLIKTDDNVSKRKKSYSPNLVIGTYKISKEQKLNLAFIGYILSKLQKEKPVYGTIIGCRNISY